MSEGAGLRRRAGALLLALAVGAAVFALSCLVERPGDAPAIFGLVYAGAAQDPWALGGMFPHRIVFPALAHAAGLLGVGFAAFSHACTALFLAAVFHAARRLGGRSFGIGGALLATHVVAATGAVQLYKSHVGYPDPLSFALLALSVAWLRSTPAFWTCTLLSLFVHEQVAFFLPALLLARVRGAGVPWRGEAARLAAVLAVYLAFRWYVARHDSAAAVGPGFYAANHYFPLGFLGLLALAPATALLYFGPVLALAGAAWGASTARWQRAALLLHAAGIVAILTVAHDVQRFVNFMFLPALLGAVALPAAVRPRAVLAALALAQAVVWAFVHPDLAAAAVRHMHECDAITGNPAHVPRLWTCVVPRIWPWLLAGALLALLLCAAGARAVRLRASPPADTFA